MNSNEKYYSFKKNPQAEIIIGLTIISIILSIFWIVYFYVDKFLFDKRDGDIMPISNPDDFSTVKLFNGLLIVLCFIVIIILL